jgi:hypothetical protein
MENEAIGQYEAAALMGVHFSRPTRMARDGILVAHVMRAHGSRKICFFERRQCEENWQQYLQMPSFGRPRSRLDEREEILRRLADESRPRIAVDDAICTEQAAELLGCYPTLISRLAKQGKIVGRRLLSGRGDENRLWIYSRRSCIAHAEIYASLMLTGSKRGRPRSGMPVVTSSCSWGSYVTQIREMLAQERGQSESQALEAANQQGFYDEKVERQEKYQLDRSNDPNPHGDPFWHSYVGL